MDKRNIPVVGILYHTEMPWQSRILALLMCAAAFLVGYAAGGVLWRWLIQ